ncbi:MAG: PIG-L family deacetylase [Verrucomicrobia bacterium]|nr:PIG-L family deacetylase [Verrucomicrobiota bacterium]
MNRKNHFVSEIVLAAVCFVFVSGACCAEEAWNATLATGKKPPAAAPREDGKLSIIAFGAHPDDSELKAGGVGALWAAQGHHVKLVSTTNGDVGHWSQAGGTLAQRRSAETQKCDAPRRRVDADAGKPPYHHAADPRVEGGHRARAALERLPSRPPLHGHPRAGRGVHGDGAVLLPGGAVSGKEPGVPLLLRRFRAAESVPTRHRGLD